ncbi:MAG: ABC transporter ATP-binding protein, partial [Alphaproteobacteria bacterium]|nr:ABC transporter ATP-binding protein [Alphaproteobacteria bacterium]
GIIQHGRLLVEGTLAELRQRAGAEHSTLEDVFLKLVAAPQDAAPAAGAA